MATLFQLMRVLLTALVAPFLPERYRTIWPWQELVNMPGLQTAQAFLCAVAGVVFWFWGQVVYQKQMAEMVAAILADERGSGNVGTITHYGLVTYFAFMFTVKGFFLTLFLLDGIARATAGAMSGVVPGTLFLAIPFLFWRLARRGVREVVMIFRYGTAHKPDSVIQEGDTLCVRRTRPHPEWNAHLAFRHEDKLYRLHHYDDRAHANGRPCFEYWFKPWPEGQTLRRVVSIREGADSTPTP